MPRRSPRPVSPGRFPVSLLAMLAGLAHAAPLEPPVDPSTDPSDPSADPSADPAGGPGSAEEPASAPAPEPTPGQLARLPSDGPTSGAPSLATLQAVEGTPGHGAGHAPDLPIADTTGPQVFDAPFHGALGVPTDLLMEGVDAAAQVDFTVPEEWEVLDDPVVTLELAHSASLLPDRSHLTVSLNGQDVASVALDGSNGRDGKLLVSLPRSVLQPYNHLRLRAVQHYGAACEDPFDPGLWTRVHDTSSLSVRYRRRPVVAELARFPFPLFDPTGYGPAQLTLVTAPAPSAATLDAVGRVGVTLGRLADYRGVQVEGAVTTVREARTHAVLVGVFDETPEIGQLLGEAPPPPGQGLVALVPNPADPTHAVLVVTGGDAEGLAHAALALAGQNRQKMLTGPQARVDFVSDGRPPSARRIPLPVPPDSDFTLATLGMDDRTVRGFYTPPVHVALELEGDAAIRPGDAEAIVHYAYGAGLDAHLSAMEVRLDGVALKSVALDDADGSTDAEVRVPLPEGVMTPRSTLDVAFTLFPKDFDSCRFISDRTLWATVFADTSFHLARDRVADLPDLGRLRYGAWPFTLEPAGGAVVAALPDHPTPADVGAGFLLAAQLGRLSSATFPSLRLVTGDAVDFSAAPDAQFVLLTDGAPHTLYDKLAQAGLLAFSGGAARTLSDHGERAMVVTVPDTEGRIEELLQPANPDRAALVLTAPQDGDLRDLVEAVTDPTRVSALSGDAALVGPDGATRSLATAEPHQVGSHAVGAALQLSMRRHWMALGAAMVGGALLFTQVKRAWMRARGH